MRAGPTCAYLMIEQHCLSAYCATNDCSPFAFQPDTSIARGSESTPGRVVLASSDHPVGLRMNQLPSFVPPDDDRDVYLVLDDFGGRLGRA
jgi:hypothetical protein